MGLEGFVHKGEPTASVLTKEKEDDMSSLAPGFAARMSKRGTNALGETTPGSEGPGDKRPRRSGPKEEAQKSPIVIAMDSPERALDDTLALEGATQGAL